MYFNSHTELDLCLGHSMVHLFDMLHSLMGYLGNLCQITVAVRHLNMKAISFFVSSKILFNYFPYLSVARQLVKIVKVI